MAKGARTYSSGGGAGGMIVIDGIGPVLDFMVVNAGVQALTAMESGAERAQQYAQSHAPWSDITGMARAGLTGYVEMDGLEVVLNLEHSVDYGIWLEVANEGRFAIIMPTLELLAPEILREAGAAVFDTGF